MKIRRQFGITALTCALLGVSSLALLAQGGFQAPAPDLIIPTVIESGTTATVVVHNGGLGTNTTFMVRAFEWKNGAWYGAGYKWVNGLAAGANMTVQISAPGIANAHNKYVVDANDAVTETNENNNTYYLYTP